MGASNNNFLITIFENKDIYNYCKKQLLSIIIFKQVFFVVIQSQDDTRQLT